jgi:hypothetical protein
MEKGNLIVLLSVAWERASSIIDAANTGIVACTTGIKLLAKHYMPAFLSLPMYRFPDTHSSAQ